MIDYVESYPRNISLDELVTSSKADELRIDNRPKTQRTFDNLFTLAHAMQKLRAKIRMVCGVERKITIKSGYRSPALNTAVGGARTSAHLEGSAVDFVVENMTPYEVCKFITIHMPELEFDQLICEYNSWVHLGYRHSKHGRRGEVFSFVRRNGQKMKVNGVVNK